LGNNAFRCAQKNCIFLKNKKKKEMTSVSVRVSQLGEDAGYGLFANKPFKPGDFIASYQGRARRGPCLRQDAKETAYVFEWEDEDTGETFHIDALDDPCPAMYCNDARGPISIKGLDNNAYFDISDSMQPCLRAMEHIDPRDEIFVSYGKDYWRGRGFFLTAQTKKKTLILS
jgi:hypothetical protein